MFASFIHKARLPGAPATPFCTSLASKACNPMYILKVICYAQGLRLALYKGLHATAARLVQKGGCRTGSDNRALWVKLTKMLDVPGVAHRNSIFGLQADCARPGDTYYPIRAFPLWRQLVGILGRLNAPKNKVAFLKALGMNLAAR